MKKPARKGKRAAKCSTSSAASEREAQRISNHDAIPQSPVKRDKRIHTGLVDDWKFFLGGSSKIAGTMRCRQPYINEYEQIESHQLSMRIIKDADELFSRAHGAKGDEGRVAAAQLAHTGVTIASYLEHLCFKRSQRMAEVAVHSNLWPVNVGLKRRRMKGQIKVSPTRTLRVVLTRLTELGLGELCEYPCKHETGAESISPVTLAAEDVLTQIIVIKKCGRIAFKQVTPWYDALMKLPLPMTISSFENWWKVTKMFLYERWEKAEHEFEPLKTHLGLELSNEYPYNSSIKSRIIDNALKEAMRGLAKRDL